MDAEKSECVDEEGECMFEVDAIGGYYDIDLCVWRHYCRKGVFTPLVLGK